MNTMCRYCRMAANSDFIFGGKGSMFLPVHVEPQAA